MRRIGEGGLAALLRENVKAAPRDADGNTLQAAVIFAECEASAPQKK